MRDPALSGRWFTPATSWARWAVFLSALFGLPMSREALAIFREHTGRECPPSDPREAWLPVGRRGPRGGGNARAAAEHARPLTRARIV